MIAISNHLAFSTIFFHLNFLYPFGIRHAMSIYGISFFFVALKSFAHIEIEIVWTTWYLGKWWNEINWGLHFILFNVYLIRSVHLTSVVGRAVVEDYSSLKNANHFIYFDLNFHVQSLDEKKGNWNEPVRRLEIPKSIQETRKSRLLQWMVGLKKGIPF